MVFHGPALAVLHGHVHCGPADEHVLYVHNQVIRLEHRQEEGLAQKLLPKCSPPTERRSVSIQSRRTSRYTESPERKLLRNNLRPVRSVGAACPTGNRRSLLWGFGATTLQRTKGNVVTGREWQDPDSKHVPHARDTTVTCVRVKTRILATTTGTMRLDRCWMDRRMDEPRMPVGRSLVDT
eukprot:872624-Prorocentrum_minimum.AAC.6